MVIAYLTQSGAVSSSVMRTEQSRHLYDQMNLRRQAIRHLILNWEILGKEMMHDVEQLYGRIDSEIDGKPLVKIVKVGNKNEEVWGYSVQSWCKMMITNRVYCDSIFLKLVASMWGCRICVVRCDSLAMVTYRYQEVPEKEVLEQAEFILIYNGNPSCGHYSGVLKCHKNLAYDSVDCSEIYFTGNYRKSDDLDERLNNGRLIWDLDLEDEIFTEERGYQYVDEDKESAKKSKGGRGKKTVQGKIVTLGPDEMIVKKSDWEDLQKKCDALEIEMEQVRGSGGGDIGEEEEKMKRNMDMLKGQIKKFKKMLDAAGKGKDLEEVFEEDIEDDEDVAKKKRSGGQPPDPEMGRLFKARRIDAEPVIKENVLKKGMYKPGDTRCKLCDEDHGSHSALVTHFEKAHKNKYLFTCEREDCGKGFMSLFGYRLHVAAHDKANRLPCPKKKEKGCTKTFGSKAAVSKHMREQHPTKEQAKKLNVKCRFCSKVCKTAANCKDHEAGCDYNEDRKEMYCEICKQGPWYLSKRVMDHKRTAHGFK